MSSHPQQVDDELDLLAEVLAGLAPLQRGLDIVELGCGNARLVRALLQRHAGCRVTALEVDAVQHAKNLAAPQRGLRFVAAPAQAVPCADASFDLALMLKSLHHVPLQAMNAALGEARRVLRAQGLLYVSEPVYAGALNDITRLFNDEGAVRAAAQAALDRAIARGDWDAVLERRFASTVHFAGFADFEHRMIDVSFAERHLDPALRTAVRERFEPHCGSGGARFVRPMHMRLLRRRGG